MSIFNHAVTREPPLLIWGRRILSLVAAALMLDAAFSGYRAWVQVYSLSVQAPDSVLAPGATVAVHVVTSGRTFVEIRLELLQSGQATLLAVREIRKNHDAAQDPRPQRYTLSIALPPVVWNRCHSGPALLRATAIGRPQWMRTPPPTVRDIAVTLQ